MNIDITTQILGPVIALVAWTQVMWLWLYITRIPAVKAANMKFDSNALRGDQMATLPAKVRWKADNYNHLMEQPILFYALAISLALLGEGSGLSLTCAWIYVAIRVVHSLFQSLVNIIEIRFTLFALSNIPLFIMLYQAVKALMA